MESKKIDTADPFVPAGFVMIRAPLLPIEILSTWTDSTPESSECDGERLRTATEQWIQAQLAQPYVQEALLAGSPDLFAALKRYKNDPDSRKGRRAQANLFRYLLRMTMRPTPFGLFAGVALAELGAEMDIRLGPVTQHRKRLRPDMQWCMSLVRELERREEVIPHLRFFTNPTLYQAGERLYLPVAEAYGQEEASKNASLRATPIVGQVLASARHGKTFAAIEEFIREARPQVPHNTIRALIKELCSVGVLLSDLRPPLTGVDAVMYMKARIEDLPGCEDIRAVLRDVAALMQAYQTQPLGDGVDALQRVLDITGSFNEHTRSNLETDLALSLEGSSFSMTVAQEIAHAAVLLLRLSMYPLRFQHLDIYRGNFIERYGEGREIPLLELLDEETGLGPPPTYEHPPPMRENVALADKSYPERERTLLALAATAIRERKHEIELDEETVQQLEGLPDRWQDALPDSLDLYVSLLASSQAAINADDYQIVIGPRLGDDPAGRSFGRFYDILGQESVAGLRDLARAEEDAHADTIFAELVYLPNGAHAANVALCPLVREHEIAVDVSPGVPFEKMIPPNDLVVGIEEGRFYARSLTLRKKVIARSTHLLNWFHAPNVCHFLMEIGREGAVHLADITWSSAAALPFVPRLRTGRVVLRPAEWHLPSTLLGGGSLSGAEQLQMFRQWREQWDVPRQVYLAENDNRLLLDLENPLCIRELIDACNEGAARRATVHLQEVLPDFAHTWVPGADGHFVSEFVVPLVRRRTEAGRTSMLQESRTPVPRSVYQCLPGSDWLYVKLYSGRTRHDDLLSGPIRQFVEQATTAGLIDRWFFIRYTDPDAHLRLRFHGTPSALLRELAPTLTAWAQTLVEDGLVRKMAIDTYDREVERYGGPIGIDLAERLFAVDSTLITNILMLRAQRVLSIDSTDLALLTVDDLLIGLGKSVTDRLTVYRSMRRSQGEQFGWEIDSLRKSFHPYRKVAQRILGDRTWAREQPGGSELAGLLQQRSAHLFAIAEQFTMAREGGEIRMSEVSILGGYIHMHYNRLLGLDRRHEFSIMYFLERTLESMVRFAPPDIPIS